jgi:hypothetical protein
MILDLQRTKCQIFCFARRGTSHFDLSGFSGFSGLSGTLPSGGENPSLRHLLASLSFLLQNAKRR